MQAFINACKDILAVIAAFLTGDLVGVLKSQQKAKQDELDDYKYAKKLEETNRALPDVDLDRKLSE